MKCRMKKEFAAYHTGPGGVLKLKSLILGFQDAVAQHSEKSGCGLQWLLKQNRAWVMHRMCIDIKRMPQLGEELTFITWHKGDKGYRAYRDYEVWSGSEKCVSAASLWLFIDLEKKKILKIPGESREWYTVETQNALACDIDAFRPVSKPDSTVIEPITIRSSDMDPIGHVNHAMYFDFLETAIMNNYGGQNCITSLMIQFHNEIAAGTPSVEAGIKRNGNRIDFNIISEKGIHAFGELFLKAAPEQQG